MSSTHKSAVKSALIFAGVHHCRARALASTTPMFAGGEPQVFTVKAVNGIITCVQFADGAVNVYA
jgi:hypothetical protein